MSARRHLCPTGYIEFQLGHLSWRRRNDFYRIGGKQRIITDYIDVKDEVEMDCGNDIGMVVGERPGHT